MTVQDQITKLQEEQLQIAKEVRVSRNFAAASKRIQEINSELLKLGVRIL